MSADADALLEAAAVLREQMVDAAGQITAFRGAARSVEDFAVQVTRLHRGWCALHAQAIAILDPDT